MAYAPEPIAAVSSQDQLVEYLVRELTRISGEFQLIEDGMVVPIRGVAPTKPREGMLVMADGTGWNPGSGKGLYEYKSGAWVKL